MWPNASSVAAIAARTDAQSAMSTATAMPSPPNRRTVSRARDSSRSHSAMRAPERTSRPATAAPMPCAPPVITA